ncbi:MAG: oligopeptide/dipeptide ABC transporter ATP-binding protein [Mycobacterium sp.]
MINVRDVVKHFPIREGVFQKVSGQVRAVDGVSFDIRRGETLGLVGESGCGKTTLGRVIAGLMPPTEGGVFYGMDDGSVERIDALRAIDASARTSDEQRELARLTDRFRIDQMPKAAWRTYRRNCQVVFQDAFASLNPRHLVIDIVGRPLKVHHEASGAELTERVVDLLESVGLGRQHLYRYPHQFSGGQRQRISIARALALDPDFIVLDEPTSALDVSVQAQILNLLHQLQQERGLTYLFISHDLGVVQHMSDRIIVMYLGAICEIGGAAEIFADPRHPYTEALLAANPSLDASASIRLAGSVPDPAAPPEGCRFHTRCPVVTERCGWDVSDVLRVLGERGRLLDGLSGVERRTPFDATLAFESSDQAAAVHAELSSDRGASPMRSAHEALELLDRTVHVRFPSVEEMSVRAVGDGHHTACLLYADRMDDEGVSD